jgi:hypothetical protein
MLSNLVNRGIKFKGINVVSVVRWYLMRGVVHCFYKKHLNGWLVSSDSVSFSFRLFLLVRCLQCFGGYWLYYTKNFKRSAFCSLKKILNILLWYHWIMYLRLLKLMRFMSNFKGMK